MILQKPVKNPLTVGNSKLGPSILGWSLPALKTCPGASPVCEIVCYATKGFYNFKNVKDTLATNMTAWQADDWTDRVVSWVKAMRPVAVRIHVSGDFYDVTYTRKWIEIVGRSTGIPFYAYTRSWVDTELRPELVKLSRHRNMYLWWSGDKSMPAPPKVKGISRAYMRVDDDDVPRWKPDLIFNELKSVFTPGKFVSGTLVCPAEQRIERSTVITCDKCRLCFTNRLSKVNSKK